LTGPVFPGWNQGSLCTSFSQSLSLPFFLPLFPFPPPLLLLSFFLSFSFFFSVSGPRAHSSREKYHHYLRLKGLLRTSIESSDEEENYGSKPMHGHHVQWSTPKAAGNTFALELGPGKQRGHKNGGLRAEFSFHVRTATLINSPTRPLLAKEGNGTRHKGSRAVRNHPEAWKWEANVSPATKMGTMAVHKQSHGYEGGAQTIPQGKPGRRREQELPEQRTSSSQSTGGGAGLSIRKHVHFSPRRETERHVRALAHNQPKG